MGLHFLYSLKNISESLTLSDDDSSSESSYDGTPVQDQSSNFEKAPEQIEGNYIVDVGSSPIGTWESHTKVCIMFVFLNYYLNNRKLFPLSLCLYYEKYMTNYFLYGSSVLLIYVL